MAKKLISLDDSAAAGSRLPASVRTEIATLPAVAQAVKSINGTTPDGAGNVAVTPVPVSALTLPIVRWGDSLTANWTASIGPLYTALGRAALDNQSFGIGSQKSDQIAARQGGKPAKLAAALVLPAGTAATAITLDIDMLQGAGVATSGTRSLAVSIMGIKGTLTATNPGTTPWTYTFARTTSGYGMTIPSGTPVVAGVAYHDHLPIIWTGRNSAQLAGAATDIPALIEAMLKNTRHHDRALVLSIPPDAAETTGTGTRTTLDAVNAAIRDAFPANFVDAAAWVRDPAVLTGLGYTLTTQDNTDIANGITPTQFRSDTLHLNATGYVVLNALIELEYRAREYAAAAAATVPGAPSGLAATAGNGQATLSWFAPGTGGSVITDYVVQYKLSSSGTWLTFADGVSTSAGVIVTGLTNGSAYDFQVAAVNSIGTGSYSSTVSTTPAAGSDTQAPTVPGTPVATAGDASNSVAFAASSDNLLVVGYRVYSSADGYVTPVATGATSPIVAPATNGTAVTYQVAAYDAAGNQSAKSPASNSVTPVAAWTTFTSDSFSGGPVASIYNRNSDAALGGTSKLYAMGSSTARLAIDADNRLVSGSAPAAVTAGFVTGFTDARASIKVVSLFPTAAAAPMATLFCSRSGTGASSTSTEIASQINRTTTGAFARVQIRDAGTIIYTGPDRVLVAGDVVDISIAGTSVVQRINGVVTDTYNHTGAKPNSHAGITAGHATETFAYDDLKIEQHA
ncbi:fibronectin type III domain-containing protein [Rhodococcus fascians]|nr:fibronectin type III domain-containing protein [Rhodococcus fascians]